MSESSWQQTVDSFRQEVTSITGRVGVISTRFSTGCRQAESLKVAFMMYCLERQRRHLARTRGFTSIMRDRKGLGKSLAMGAAGLIVSGMITGDKLSAAKEGISSFNAALQAHGETTWAVSLGKDFKVLPRGDVTITTPGKTPVTWESLKHALARLEREAWTASS